ncbi:hypothetical protein AT1219_11162 [Vibrio alginolyticus]
MYLYIMMQNKAHISMLNMDWSYCFLIIKLFKNYKLILYPL